MSEETTFLLQNKILQHLKDGYNKMSYTDLKLLKYNNDEVQLEEDDVENCTSREQAEDNDEGEYSVEEDEDDERDLTNLTWLTELRNQTMGFVNMAFDEEPKKDNELKTVEDERISTHLPHDVTGTEASFKAKTNILGQQNQRNIMQSSLKNSDEPRAVKMFNQPKRPSPGERYEVFLNKIKR